MLDLNKAVAAMIKILRRLIGEDIELIWQPGEQQSAIKIDPTQIDQILANLCVNARDAITGVGNVTIETAATSFDEEYCALHTGFLPGEYVLLSVSDDGVGMDSATVSKIFEPFFTTKAMGRGTGLGLATVYGIVKQNNGFINVYSEPGRGSTFKIYLPRYAGEAVAAFPQPAAEIVPGRGETLLLVEDETAILKLGRKMLEALGYHVLTAKTPTEALAVAHKLSGKLDLLITDVIMPEMNGSELAARLQALDADIKVLFMSGYTANIIVHRGMLDNIDNFILKPFSKKDLAAKVRQVLDRGAAGTPHL
jgi:CheY-like chemotaxis protein